MTKTNWIDTVKVSLPEHMQDLQNNLSLCMNPAFLTEREAHACALAAAIASGNGELAFEISMNSPLFGDPIREIVAQAVQFETMNGPLSNTRRIMEGQGYHTLTVGGIYKTAYTANPQDFHLYGFVTAVVNNNEMGIKHYIQLLKTESVDDFKIIKAAFIASVVSSIAKVVI